ncbi:hypothetical protein SAMN05444161_4584 [Rhizobiales bacterium GAS191]|nr:hypothetical protein SAMN05444161_4584 [Rhizobiales bacterium GAS191]
MAMSRAISDEWIELKEILEKFLRSHGAESAFGEGDFWIVDEFYEFQQKIYFTSWKLVKPNIIEYIQREILKLFTNWIVIVVVDLSDPIHREPVAWFRISFTEITKFINSERLPPELKDLMFP